MTIEESEAEVPPPELRSASARPGRSRKIVTDSLFSLLSQLSSGVFSAIITFYLARALAPTQFGDFSLAIAIGTVVALPADFGVSSAIARFVADNRHDRPSLPAIVADGVKLKLIGSVVACGALAAVAPLIADAYHAPLTWPLRLVALAVVGQNVLFLFESTFIADFRMPSYVRVVISESAVECGSTVLIVALGGGLVGATVGRAIGYLVGALVAMVISARVFRWHSALRRGSRSETHAKRIIRFALPVMLIDGANAIFVMEDILLIGAFLGSHQAGLFSAPARLLAPLFYPSLAVSNAISPRLARRAAGGPDGQALAGGLRALILLYALAMTPLLIWPKPIVHILLGGGYAGSVDTMRLLSFTVLFGGIVPLISSSVTYLGEASRRIPLMIGAAVLDAGIDVVLIPRIGIISGAIATAVAYLGMLIGHAFLCERHVKLPFRQLGASTARAAVAAAAMAGVLALFGSDPGIPALAVGLIAGTLVYGGVLLASRELSPDELVLARRWVRQRLGRASG